jgi:hypothetical protein
MVINFVIGCLFVRNRLVSYAQAHLPIFSAKTRNETPRLDRAYLLRRELNHAYHAPAPKFISAVQIGDLCARFGNANVVFNIHVNDIGWLLRFREQLGRDDLADP